MHSMSRSYLIFYVIVFLTYWKLLPKKIVLTFLKLHIGIAEFCDLIFVDTGFPLFLALYAFRHEDFSHWAAFEYGLSDWLRGHSRSFGSFAKNIGLLGQCRFSDAWQLYVHQNSEQ